MCRGMTNDVLETWRSCIMNAPVQFTMLKHKQDVEWARINSREEIAKRYQFLHRTCIDRIFEVSVAIGNYEEQTKQKATPAVITKIWNKNVSMSEMSEVVNEAFVDVAMTVRSRIFAHKPCLDLLLAADDEFQSKTPWQSAYLLQAITQKVAYKSEDMRI